MYSTVPAGPLLLVYEGACPRGAPWRVEPSPSPGPSRTVGPHSAHGAPVAAQLQHALPQLAAVVGVVVVGVRLPRGLGGGGGGGAAVKGSGRAGRLRSTFSQKKKWIRTVLSDNSVLKMGMDRGNRSLKTHSLDFTPRRSISIASSSRRGRPGVGSSQESADPCAVAGETVRVVAEQRIVPLHGGLPTRFK